MIYVYVWLAVTAMCAIWSYVHKRWIVKAAAEGKKIMTPKLGKAGNIWAKLWLSVAFSFATAILTNLTEGTEWRAIVFVVGETIVILGYIWLTFDLFLNWWRGLKATYVSKYNNKKLDSWFDGSWRAQFTAKIGVMTFGALVIIVSQVA